MKQNKIKMTYYISMIINFIFTALKIVGGLLGKSETLLVDGVNTFCEFISNIISLIGSKISRRRSNHTHPFGYGTVEYVTNLFVGIIILLLGVLLFIKTFISETEVPNFNLIYLLMFVMIGKLFLGFYLNKRSTELNSSSLLISAKQAFVDCYSSLLTFIVVVLSQFSDKLEILKYSDFVGSLIISIIIFYTGFKIIKQNVLPLSGEVLEDHSIIGEIEKKVEKLGHVDLTDIGLIKHGSYYLAQITIEIDPRMSALRIVKLEDKITKILKSKKYNIKYVTINVELDKGNK